MARVTSANNYISVSAAPITAYPFTMHAVFNANTIAGNISHVFSMGDTNANSYMDLFIVDTGVCWLVTRNSGTTGIAASTTIYTATNWASITGVATTSTSRAVYLNGAGKGTNTTPSVTWPAGIDNTAIGTLLYSSSHAEEVDGSIAECAIWNVALTDAEVASLTPASGVFLSPLAIRPQSLVVYWPLIRDTDDDIVGGYSMTPSGSPTIGPHARVYYPGLATLGVPAPAAAGDPEALLVGGKLIRGGLLQGRLVR